MLRALALQLPGAYSANHVEATRELATTSERLRRLEERARAEYAQVHAAEGGGVVEEPSLEELLPFDNPADQPLGPPICEPELLAAEGEIPYAHLLAPDDPLLAGSRR